MTASPTLGTLENAFWTIFYHSLNLLQPFCHKKKELKFSSLMRGEQLRWRAFKFGLKKWNYRAAKWKVKKTLNSICSQGKLMRQISTLQKPSKNFPNVQNAFLNAPRVELEKLEFFFNVSIKKNPSPTACLEKSKKKQQENRKTHMERSFIKNWHYLIVLDVWSPLLAFQFPRFDAAYSSSEDWSVNDQLFWSFFSFHTVIFTKTAAAPSDS